MYTCVMGIDFTCLYDFSVRFWNKNFDIKFNADDTFLEYTSSGILKAKGL